MMVKNTMNRGIIPDDDFISDYEFAVRLHMIASEEFLFKYEEYRELIADFLYSN